MSLSPIELIHGGTGVFVRPFRPARSRALFVRIAREPLLHFLALGALLYQAGTLLKTPPAVARQTRIEIPAAQVRRLREVWTMQWHRPPRREELQSLIDDYVREEVLYREAIAMGLDRDDDIVRRRLAQKMEFLEQRPRAGAETETETPD